MLLSALLNPEAIESGIGVSRYVERAPSVTGTFLWGVAIMAVVIFVGAVLHSMRVSPEPPK